MTSTFVRDRGSISRPTSQIPRQDSSMLIWPKQAEKALASATRANHLELLDEVKIQTPAVKHEGVHVVELSRANGKRCGMERADKCNVRISLDQVPRNATKIELTTWSAERLKWKKQSPSEKHLNDAWIDVEDNTGTGSGAKDCSSRGSNRANVVRLVAKGTTHM